MRRSIISSERSMSGKRRIASALRRASSADGGLPPAGAMPMRSSIVCVMSSVDRVARTRCRAPRTTSACGRLRLPNPLRRARALRRDPRCRCAIAVPAIGSSKCACMSSTFTARISAAEAFDGADARERRDRRLAHALAQQVLRLRDVREHLGPRRERRVEDLGAERGAVRLPATRRSPGCGCCVRGDT